MAKAKAGKRSRSRKAKAEKPAARSTSALTGSKWADFKTNSNERKMGTRKENRCQLCLTKVDIGDQYTVVNDLEAGEAKKAKNADKHPELSHYCTDCADKRVTRKEYWMSKVREGSGPDQRGQSSGRKRGGKASAKKAAGKSGKGKAARSRKRGADATEAKPKRQRRRAKKTETEAAASDEPF